jgi:hypothetical protein
MLTRPETPHLTGGSRLMGPGVVSSLILIFWLVYTLQIYHIALYVVIELRPQLIRICQRPVLKVR